MRKYLLALLFTPMLALAHEGHGIIDFEQQYNTRITCDRSTFPSAGCNGGDSGAGAFGLVYFINTYCNGDVECRNLTSNRGYLIHLKATGNGPTRHYHVTIYVEITNQGSAMQGREVSLHSAVFLGFNQDLNNDPSACAAANY